MVLITITDFLFVSQRQSLKQVTQAHIALLCVAIIYGANFTIAKEVMDNDYIQPLGFIVLRVGFAVCLFLAVHRLFVKERVRREDLKLLALCGLLGVGINQCFFFSGLKLTKPINAALIITITPLIVLLFSAFLGRERITLLKLLGLLIGATGTIFLISYGKSFSFDPRALWGDILIFATATVYGIYLVLVKSLMKKYHPLTVIKWVFGFGFFMVLPIGAGQLSEVQWSVFPPMIWAATFYVLLFATFLTYFLNVFALKFVDATVVSIYLYLQPMFAAFIAVLLDRDELTGVKLICGLLIFSGVYLVSQQEKSKKNVTNY